MRGFKPLIKLISKITKREESRILNKKIICPSLEMLDSMDDWVWMKDAEDNILYINNSALKSIFGRYFDDSLTYKINSTKFTDSLPADIKGLLFSRAHSANLIINNSDKVIKVSVKTRHSVSSDIWYTIAKKVK